MPNIHHATAARASKLNIQILVNEDETFTAIPESHPTRLGTHKDAKVALNLAELGTKFGDEYGNVAVSEAHGVWATTCTVEGTTHVVVEFDPTTAKIEDVFVDTLEKCVEEGYEFEEVESDDRGGKRGNIVPRKYREKYAAQGHAHTCGDWLANILNDECTAIDEKGKPYFDIERFDEIYDQNKGPRTGKWATSGNRNPGWQGRYRMSGRIALAKVVAINGYLVVDGSKLTPSGEWLTANTPKAAKAA